MNQKDRIRNLEVSFKILQHRMDFSYPKVPGRDFRPKVMWMWQLQRIIGIVERATSEASEYDARKHSLWERFRDFLHDFLGIVHLPRHREFLLVITELTLIMDGLEELFPPGYDVRNSKVDPSDVMHSLRDQLALFLTQFS